MKNWYHLQYLVPCGLLEKLFFQSDMVYPL